MEAVGFFNCQQLVEVSGSNQLFHGCLETKNRAFIMLIQIIARSVVVLGLTTVMVSEL